VSEQTLFNQPPTPPAAVPERLVHAVSLELRKRWGPCDHDDCDDDTGMCHLTMIREVLEVAAAHGQPPAGAEVTEEWGTRVTWPDGSSQTWFRESRAAAEKTASFHRPPMMVTVGQVVRRQVWTGPWQTDTEKEDR
jgi:hypothetical protein